MILVLAGTKDGRLLAASLAEAGYPVLASAVTLYGGALLKEGPAREVRHGPLDEEGLVAIMRERQVTLVVDATHPFATAARQNARQACERLRIPRLRFERASLPLPQHSGAAVLSVAGINGAVRAAAACPGNIFLTTGSSSVAAFARALGPERLIVRLLPDAAAMQRCAALGIGPHRLIAMQGPFSMEMNREMFRHFNAALVVSKESGKTGGLSEKIAAAAALQLPIIIISRPSLPDGPVFSDSEALLAHVKKLL